MIGIGEREAKEGTEGGTEGGAEGEAKRARREGGTRRGCGSGGAFTEPTGRFHGEKLWRSLAGKSNLAGEQLAEPVRTRNRENSNNARGARARQTHPPAARHTENMLNELVLLINNRITPNRRCIDSNHRSTPFSRASWLPFKTVPLPVSLALSPSLCLSPARPPSAPLRYFFILRFILAILFN